MTAPIGRYPLVMPFAHVMMSGSSPKRFDANQSPRAAEAGDDLVGDEQHAGLAADLARGFQVAGRGGKTPPAPITGSQKNAATRLGPVASIAARRASASLHGTSTTSSIRSPWPVALAGMPASDVPAVCMP